MRQFYLNSTLLLGSFFLVGCQTQVVELKQETINNTLSVSSANSPESDHSGAELSEQLFNDILLSLFAVYRDSPEQATSAMLRSSESWRNSQFLEMATKTALYYKQFSDAQQLANRWLSVIPHSSKAYYYASLASLQLGHTAKATNILSQLITQQDTVVSRETIIEQIRVTLMQQSLGEAGDQVLLSLSELYPASVQANITEAIISIKNGDNETAQNNIDHVLKSENDNAIGLVLQLRLINISDETEEKLINFDRKLVSFQHKIRDVVAPELANSYLLIKNYKRANYWYKQQLKVSSKNTELLSLWAYTAYKLGLYEEIVRHPGFQTQTTLTTSPYLQASKIILNESNSYETVSLDTSFEVFVDIIKLLISKSYNTRAQNFLDGNENLVDTYTPEQQNSIAAQHTYILQQTKGLDVALEYIDEVIAHDSEDSELLSLKASLEYKKGDNDNYISTMKLLIKSNPNNATWLNAAGYVLLTEYTDRIKQAEDYILRAYNIDDKSGYILDSLGWLYFAKKDYKLAYEYLAKAYAVDQDPEIAAHYGEVLWLIGKKDEARKLWMQSLEIDPSNKALLGTLEKHEVSF